MNGVTKQLSYQSPSIEVIEVQNQASIMAGSDLPNVNGGGDIFQSSSPAATRMGTKHQQANPLQELEDMLNDFLTF